MAKKRGRPTEFKEEYTKQLIEYFDVDSFSVMTKAETGEPVLNKQGQAVLKGARFPTLAGFACKIGVHRDTLHEWSRATVTDKNGNDVVGDDGKPVLKYKDFSDAYARAKGFQERTLVEGALVGVFNPQFSIFFAKNNLGWDDKVTNELTGPGGGPVKTQSIIFKGVSSDND